MTTIFAPGAIFGALGTAMPERVMAESGMVGSPYFTLRTSDGQQISQFFSTNGGLGARFGKDGLSTCSFPTNVSNVPVEVVERTSGLIVEKRELLPDSGGAGCWRGGLGQVHVIRVPSDFVGAASVSILSDRTAYPATGLLGGGVGGRRRNIRNGTEELHPKKRTVLAPGDRTETQMPGGGGIGDPLERDPGSVEWDVLNGYVSESMARAIYGFEGGVLSDPFAAAGSDVKDD